MTEKKEQVERKHRFEVVTITTRYQRRIVMAADRDDALKWMDDEDRKTTDRTKRTIRQLDGGLT